MVYSYAWQYYIADCCLLQYMHRLEDAVIVEHTYTRR